MAKVSEHEPCYVISVAAELLGLSPSLLRAYEREQLLHRARTEGNIRLYCDADIRRAHKITEYRRKGINMAGIRAILQMEAERERVDGD